MYFHKNSMSTNIDQPVFIQRPSSRFHSTHFRNQCVQQTRQSCLSNHPLICGILLGIFLGCTFLTIVLSLWLTNEPSSTTTSIINPVKSSIFALRIPTCATWQQTGITVAGNAGGSIGIDLASLSFPTTIFIDNNDTLWITDQSNSRVVKYYSNSNVGILVAGNGTPGKTSQQLSGLKGIAVDSFGVVLVADSDNYRIQAFTPGSIEGSTRLSNMSSNLMGQMRDLHIDVNNNIYFTDSDYNRVVKYTPYSTIGIVLAGGDLGSDNSQLNVPYGSFIDGNNVLYVADRSNHRIMRFLPETNVGTIAAGVNCTPGTDLNQLKYPAAVIVDNNGYIYIADSGNNRIMRWTSNYSAGGTCVVGCSRIAGLAADEMNTPRDLKFDKYGNLYVADQGNNRIQKFLINTTCI